MSLGLQRGSLIGTGWPDGIDREIKAAIEFNQLTRPVTTAVLRSLVRAGRWADIGKIFNFEPVYIEVWGKIYFNWTCCPAEFWAAFKPRKYGLKKDRPVILETVILKSKLRSKGHPTVKLVTFQDQGGICHYCEKEIDFKQWSVDHKTPRCRGGSNAKSNKVGACKTCNHSKANLTEEEYRNTHPDERKALVKFHAKRHTEALNKLPVRKYNPAW